MSTVDSPCVNVCMMKAGFCTGCHRTLDEIANWYQMSDAEKQQVIAASAQRARTVKRAAQRQTQQ